MLFREDTEKSVSKMADVKTETMAFDLFQKKFWFVLSIVGTIAFVVFILILLKESASEGIEGFTQYLR